MKELYELLKKMEPRPGMWTGELSLKSIKTFLDGYYFALEEHNLIKSSKSDQNFHDWIALKLGFKESTAGWHRMILAVSIGLNPGSINWEDFDRNVSKAQHERSVRRFYELYEEFVNS